MLAAVSDVLAAASLLIFVHAGAALHFLKALKKRMPYTALTFSL